MVTLLIVQLLKWKREGLGQDLPLLTLGIQITAQIFSLAFRVFTMWQLKTWGIQWGFFPFMSKLYHFIADLIFSALIVLLATGFGTHWQKRIPNPKIFSVAIAIMVVRYIWVIYSHFWLREKDSLHDYEGHLGSFEIFASIIMAVWFLGSLGNVGLIKDPKYKRFLIVVTIVGLVYFMLRPLMIVLVENTVEINNQAFFVFFWEYGTFFYGSGVMMVLLLAKNGSYKQLALSMGVILMDDKIQID